MLLNKFCGKTRLPCVLSSQIGWTAFHFLDFHIVKTEQSKKSFHISHFQSIVSKTITPTIFTFAAAYFSFSFSLARFCRRRRRMLFNTCTQFDINEWGRWKFMALNTCHYALEACMGIVKLKTKQKTNLKFQQGNIRIKCIYLCRERDESHKEEGSVGV